MLYILFNPKANNAKGEVEAKNFGATLKIEAIYKNVNDLDYKKFLDELNPEDEVILTGGDGTVNWFANETYGYNYRNKIFYAKCGTGNDFYTDVKYNADERGLVDLRPYLINLPLVTVNGIKRRFINNIGLGIDGVCAEVGEEMREKDPNKKINYSAIAIKLLLFVFKTRKAEVEVDGVKFNYDHVWLSTTMFGRFYGGGMMGAPRQNRLNEQHTASLVTFSSRGRIATLLRFPKFSKGEHQGKKYLNHLVGKHIKVTFDKPCSLQIDGEIVKDVTTYTVDCE